MSEFRDSPGYYINRKWKDLPIPQNMNNGETSSIKIYNDDIYLIGFCTTENNDKNAGYWINDKWIGLPSPDKKSYNSVRELVISNNDIYLAVNRNGYWINGKWNQLGSVEDKYFLNTISVTGKNIIVAGHRTANNRFYPGYFENGNWIELKEPMEENKFGDVVHSLKIVKN